MGQALVLFAHGARDPRWAEPFQSVLARVRAVLEMPVELAFLELMTPDLESVVAGLAAQGCDEIHIVPLFLGQGSHVRRDLPERVDRLRAAFPKVSIHTAPAAGEHASVLDALASYCIAQAPKRGN